MVVRFLLKELQLPKQPLFESLLVDLQHQVDREFPRFVLLKHIRDNLFKKKFRKMIKELTKKREEIIEPVVVLSPDAICSPATIPSSSSSNT